MAADQPGASGDRICESEARCGRRPAPGALHPIRLYWGLRLVDDICLTDDLDRLAAALPDFRYAISLSQPSPDWSGLRGRLTESVPPLLETLGGKRFYLAGNGAMCEEME